MKKMTEEGMKVCVTGAGGYLASWLVKLLLSHGYTVHGTVRNPDDDKNAHLWKLENAAEKLKLFKADLLDFDSILAAVRGCDGLFHLATPVHTSSIPNPEVDMVEPAVKGTLNVLKACSEATVRRVVIVSSIVAILLNPNLPKDKAVDEAFWSDLEFCRRTNNWYSLSKTAAEAEAWDYAGRNGLDLVSVCPGIILGPMLQQTPNTSTMILVKILKEGEEEMDNTTRIIVDVRDVAEAVKLVYERREAEGRYLCTSHMIKNEDLVHVLKETYPNYNYPKSFKEGRAVPQLSSDKLKGLGWKHLPVKETLVDSVDNYEQMGLL